MKIFKTIISGALILGLATSITGCGAKQQNEANHWKAPSATLIDQGGGSPAETPGLAQDSLGDGEIFKYDSGIYANDINLGEVYEYSGKEYSNSAEDAYNKKQEELKKLQEEAEKNKENQEDGTDKLSDGEDTADKSEDNSTSEGDKEEDTSPKQDTKSVLELNSEITALKMKLNTLVNSSTGEFIVKIESGETELQARQRIEKEASQVLEDITEKMEEIKEAEKIEAAEKEAAEKDAEEKAKQEEEAKKAAEEKAKAEEEAKKAAEEAAKAQLKVEQAATLSSVIQNVYVEFYEYVLLPIGNITNAEYFTQNHAVSYSSYKKTAISKFEALDYYDNQMQNRFKLANVADDNEEEKDAVSNLIKSWNNLHSTLEKWEGQITKDGFITVSSSDITTASKFYREATKYLEKLGG